MWAPSATSRPATSWPRWSGPWRSAGSGLDESVALWERGEALARRCEEQLAGARDRVKAALEHADDPRPESLTGR